ncbi:hypothetical protein HDU67_004699 [Dinochytrium kinnereticum]|nr:hypothetical protein HDU67_004699 [Dinochytrium kinnereticum]
MAKASLLQWSQQTLFPYVEVGVLPGVGDFARAWQNGVAFLALVHTFDPYLVPELSDLFLRLDRTRKISSDSVVRSSMSSEEIASAARYVYTASKTEWMQTLSRAFSLAELKMGISRLLDPEDLIDMEPDEKSVMLYVSEFRRTLHGKPLMSAEGLSVPARRASVVEKSAVSQLQVAIASYLSDANKMTTWLNGEQQSLHRFTRALCSEKDAQPLLSNLSSWCQRTMDVLLDETSTSADISRVIRKEVSDIESILRILISDNIESASGDVDGELPSRDGFSNDLTFTDSSPVRIRCKLEGLFSRILRLSTNLPKEEELVVSYQLKEVVEVNDSLKSQIEIFSQEVFPSSSAQLRSYALFCEEWEAVLSDIRKELEGPDGDSGLKEELQAAKESVALLRSEFEESMKTPFTSNDALTALRTKLILDMVGAAAGSVHLPPIPSILAPTQDSEHPIEVLADRVEKEDVPVIRGMRHRLDELLEFLQQELLGKDAPNARATIAPNGLNSPSKQSGLTPFAFIPAFLNPYSTRLLQLALSILQPLDDIVLPELQAVVSKIKESRLSLFDLREKETTGARRSIEKARPRVEIYAFAISEVSSKLTKLEESVSQLSSKHTEPRSPLSPQDLEGLEDEITDLDSNINSLVEMIKFSLDKKWLNLMTECSLPVSLDPPHTMLAIKAVEVKSRLDKLRVETVDAAREEASRKLTGLVGEWVNAVNSFEEMVQEVGGKFSSRVSEAFALYDEALQKWLSSWVAPIPVCLEGLREREVDAIAILEDATLEDMLQAKLDELDMGTLSFLMDQAGLLLAKGLKSKEEDLISLKVSKVQSSVQKYQRSLEEKEKGLIVRRRELLSIKEQMRVAFNHGLSWLNSLRVLEHQKKVLMNDLDLVAKQLEALLESQSPFTEDLANVLSRYGKLQKRLSAMGPPPFPDDLHTSFPNSVPQAITESRLNCFTDILVDLQKSLQELESTCASIQKKIELAEALDSALQELSESSAIIDTLLDPQKSSQSLPHGLDITCTEEVIAAVERSLAASDTSVAGWKKVMRRARAEQAVAELLEMNPPEHVANFIKQRSTEILARVSLVAEVSRKRWDQVATIRVVMKEVAGPGRAIEAFWVEIEDVLADAISQHSRIIGEVEGEMGRHFELFSQLRWISGRVEEKTFALNSVVASGESVEDERVKEFCRNLVERSERIRLEICGLALNILCDACREWDGNVNRMSDVTERLRESLLQTPEDFKDVGKLSDKYEAIASALAEFSYDLTTMESRTRSIIELLHDCKAIHNSLSITLRIDAISAAVSIPISVNSPDFNRFDYLVDNLQSRSTQIRQQAESIDQTVQQALDFVAAAKTVLSDLAVVEHELALLFNNLLAFDESVPAIAGERLNESVEKDERSLLLIEARMRGAMLFSVEGLKEHDWGGMQEDEIRGVMEGIEVVWRHVEDELQALNLKLEGIHQYKVLTTGFLRQVSDLQDLISARQASLQKLETVLNHELESLKTIMTTELPTDLLTSITTQLRHSSERTVSHAKEEATLGKLRQSVRSLSILHDKINVPESDGMGALVGRFMGDLDQSMEELEEFDKRVGGRLADHVGFLEWVKEGLEVADEVIPEKILRLENGEGWSAILSEMNPEDGVREKPTLHLDAFGRLTDTLVRRWEDELLIVEERVESLRERSYNADPSQSLLCDHLETRLSRLQRIFEEQKLGLFDLGGGVETLLIRLYAVEASIDSLVSTIRNRQGTSEDPHRRPTTPSSSGGHLVITGHESIDARNMQTWIREQMETESTLRTTIAPRLEEVESMALRLDEQSSSLVKGSGRILVQQAIKRRLEGFRASFRELCRVAAEERSGMERANRYYQWHSELNLLEVQIGAMESSLTSMPLPSQQIEESLNRAADIKRSFEDLQILTSRDFNRRRSSVSSLPSPINPSAPSPGPSSTPPPPSPILGSHLSPSKERTTLAIDHASLRGNLLFNNERRPSVLSIAIPRATPTVSSPVVDALEIANLSAWRVRLDEFSQRLESLVDRLSRPMEAQDKVGEVSLANRFESLRAVVGWCEGLRGDEVELSLLTDYVAFFTRANLGVDEEELEIEHGSVLARLHEVSKDSLEIIATMKRHISEVEELREELLNPNVSGEDQDEDLTSLVEEAHRSLTSAEETVSRRTRAVDLLKQLSAFDRDWRETADWISSLTTAAQSASGVVDPGTKKLGDGFVMVTEVGVTHESHIFEDEIQQLEERLKSFGDSLSKFEAGAEALIEASELILEDSERRSAFLNAVETVIADVRGRYEGVESEVSLLQGSISRQERVKDFEEGVMEVRRLLDEIRSRLAIVAGGSGIIVAHGASTSTLASGTPPAPRGGSSLSFSSLSYSTISNDVELATVLGELEGEMERLVAPRVTELREVAASVAQTVSEREAYMQRYDEVEAEFFELGAWIERERKDSDVAAKLRSLDTLVSEILKMQAEFAVILQETAAAALPRSTTPSADKQGRRGSVVSGPTVAGMMEAASNLDSRFGWYDAEVGGRLAVLQSLAGEVGQDQRYDDLRKKWAALTFLKANSEEEIRRRLNTKKTQLAASKASSIPRIATGGGSGLGRATSASPTLQSPTSPVNSSAARSQLLRTPSPFGFNGEGRSSISPLGHRSFSNGSGRLSPLVTKHSNHPIKILLPSPNNYVPNPNDPLDVEVANVVNSLPVRIKVVPAGEGKSSYWFGDLMPRLCYCRVVRAGTVMVRVGGGWQCVTF